MINYIKWIAALLVINTAFAVEPDKAAHASGSAAISLSVAPLFADSDHPILYPFAVSFAAGVAKELYDSREDGTGFDKHDLAADALGAGIGAVVGNHIYMFAVNKGIGVGIKGKFVTSKQEGEK